ncbi:hypothetical protein ACFC1T_09120 [Kitasatospora sp. NPDC056076]|uniref:hypothetical protein n=1 Tax=Kitasatospora sp. NPDC056076 TaxID=3345703 RepID=UPI0035DF5455
MGDVDEAGGLRYVVADLYVTDGTGGWEFVSTGLHTLTPGRTPEEDIPAMEAARRTGRPEDGVLLRVRNVEEVEGREAGRRLVARRETWRAGG